MFNLYRGPAIRAAGVAGLLAASLVLAACGGAAVPTAEPTAAPATSASAPADTPTTAPEQPTAEQTTPATSEAAETAQASAATPASTTPASCEAIDIPENQAISAVTDKDWTRGPADAPLTLIEYSDFQ